MILFKGTPGPFVLVTVDVFRRNHLFKFMRLADEHMLITAHKHLLIKIECCSMTRHFYTIRSSGMSCKFCGKAFNRGFNLMMILIQKRLWSSCQ